MFVLAAVILGAALIVAVFQCNRIAADANLDDVVQECQRIADAARTWYRKPSGLGGGSRSFLGVDLERIGAHASVPHVGFFALTTDSTDQITVTGVGVKDADNDGTNVTVVLRYYADGDSTRTIIANR